MCGYLVDAYQMVVMAVQEICVADLIVRESDLVKELHKAILSMFNESLVVELMSCLVSVISSALSSYYKMGLLQSKSFSSPNGGNSRFILANWQQRGQIDRVYQQLQGVSQVKEDVEIAWGDSISKAVSKSIKALKHDDNLIPELWKFI